MVSRFPPRQVYWAGEPGVSRPAEELYVRLHIEHTPVVVVKKDGRREHFSREKILNGLLRACEKRPVSRESLEELVNEVERAVCSSVRDEIPSSEIGNEVMNRLAALDQVAYVRFASVYRDFKDVTQFLDELRNLLEKKA